MSGLPDTLVADDIADQLLAVMREALTNTARHARDVALSSGAPADLGSHSNDTSTGNYNRTTYGYDNLGRQDRTQSETGTITRPDDAHADRLWRALGHV